MVTTRSGAKSAAAPSTLKAPPKRGGRKPAASAQKPAPKTKTAEKPVNDGKAIIKKTRGGANPPKPPPISPAKASSTTAISNVSATARVTRSRGAAPPVPQEAPQLRAPARKPARKTAKTTLEEPMGEFPQYPNTPKHITAPITTKEALKELPEYPQTPAHIKAPISALEAFKALPGYPQTPAHISAPITTKEALKELPKNLTPYAKTSEAHPAVSRLSSEFPVLTTTLEASEEPPKDLSPNDSTLEDNQPEITSILRSPLKTDTKTPKKVTWRDDSENDFLLYDGPLRGMIFYVDVTSNGKDQSFLFLTLLEDMGAQVIREWNEHSYLTHVLFKEGKKLTLEKMRAADKLVKCVNVGFLLDSEKNKKRMDEAPYLIDLETAKTLPSPVRQFKSGPYSFNPTFTPARTPSRFMSSVKPPPSIKSIPDTPTSSEFDHSINYDDKENSEISDVSEIPIFLQGGPDMARMNAMLRTVQPTKAWLKNRSPIKTPSKPGFLNKSPVRAFSTTKKRMAGPLGDLEVSPPKKLRFA